ncbi:hypothetical protein Bca52824_095089 [Brassica carinata]|uniref:Polygalacturonase n=1 Tax=Brassica carinata TaxID=52824 RepID=A0A8X7TII9_BRACI|nr:hypothetical protein Bca52824_095089 [Brassica carinata]
MTILAPMNAPNTDGIDPDSSTNVCIEDCYIESGDDLLAVKSGWDQKRDVWWDIQRNHPGHSRLGLSSWAPHKKDIGRGGYISNITISNVLMEKVKVPIRFSRGSNDHPDDKWDPKAMPRVKGVYISNVVSVDSRKAPMLLGVEGASFQDICLRNVTLLGLPQSEKWKCKDVSGYASDVFLCHAHNCCRRKVRSLSVHR